MVSEHLRGTSTSDLYWIAAITDTATTFTDTGRVADNTKHIPARKNVFQSGMFPTEYYDFLWTIGYNKFHRASFTFKFNSIGTDTWGSVLPQASYASANLCKVSRRYNSGTQAYTLISGRNATKILWTDATFISSGVIPGDYFVWATGRDVPSATGAIG